MGLALVMLTDDFWFLLPFAVLTAARAISLQWGSFILLRHLSKYFASYPYAQACNKNSRWSMFLMSFASVDSDFSNSSHNE